jgi:hypothetical protein
LSFTRPALVACLLASVVPAAQADEAKAPAAAAPAPKKATPSEKAAPTQVTRQVAAPDDELLEFLGSVDSEEGDEAWLDYLSQADIAKAARKPKAAATDPEGDKK